MYVNVCMLWIMFDIISHYTNNLQYVNLKINSL